MQGEKRMVEAEWPVVASFVVRRRAYLDASGEALAPLPQFAGDPPTLIGLYRAMVLTRVFDRKAVALQRTGRLGTFAVSLGQEAVPVGTASAMRDDDVLVPSYREQGAMLWRGATATEILTYWGGDERGSDFANCRGDFPICVPVGSHAPHAAGLAYAFKLRGEDRVAVAMMGDGATSKGDVYEAMNFAGVHALPVVFVITNNRWAISVPLRMQSATATLAQKAIAAGLSCEQVDGNDVVAVRAALEEALARARAGGGATAIEAETYRLGDHTTADDAGRYRPAEEVQARWKQEPVARLRNRLVAIGAWTKAEEEALLTDCQRQVDEAAEAYLATGRQPAVSMLDHLHETLPHALEGQRRELEERGDG
ncbi:MAG: pyruvate dehydrogenase (acetyl-transferring) E1 component subunit alpha [Hyphomicrobiaceae bacterium]